jgi:FMN hydrolase / 5-amino-6-(5-phospho-D-ribitylamino)uracil phosphatase
MPTELITLDGDGTLWDFETAMHHALDDVAQQMKSWNLLIDGHHPTMQDLLADRAAVGRERSGKGLTLERLRWLAFERSLTRAGLPVRADRIDALYHRFMDLRHEGVRLFDDALSALEDLRKRRKLALITNGNTDLARLGLEKMFDVVISAQTCQFWKPDPRIFWLATTELGVQPAHVVHAGDHQQHDVQGAQAAGIRAVWVNRRSAPREVWCEPDAEIRDLSELASVLNQLEAAAQARSVRGAKRLSPRG